MLPKQALALDTGNYEVLGISQLNYAIVAGQERDTGELTIRPLPKANIVSAGKDE